MKPELRFWAIFIVISLRGFGFASASLAPCIKMDDCSCSVTTDAGELQINIRSLGQQNQNLAPRFGFKQYNPSEPWEYAYNPCYAWSDGTPNCQNVVACQRSSTHHSETFGLGDAAANWTNDGTHYFIVHSHTTRTTYIELRCEASATMPKLDYYKDQSNEYGIGCWGCLSRRRCPVQEVCPQISGDGRNPKQGRLDQFVGQH